MNKDWINFGFTEYSIRVSLRARPDRQIVVFRVDTQVQKDEYRTLFLDRAETPVDERVWAEWGQVIDNLLTGWAEHRYGLQTRIAIEE